MNIVRSRPIWSDSQPKAGRDNAFMARPTSRAKLSAGMVTPRIDTGALSMPKSAATGASWAAVIRPPAPTSANIAYISQKGRDFSISRGG